MKGMFFLACLLPLAFLHAGDIQPFDRLGRDNVTVKVKETGSGKIADYDYRAYWGSYDRKETSTKNLLVEVAKVGAQPGPVEVEFFFVMREKGGKPFALASKPVTLPEGSGEAEFSGSAEAQRERWVYANISESSGTSMTGWFVRVVRGSRIVGVAASSDTLLKPAGDPAALAGIIAKKK